MTDNNSTLLKPAASMNPPDYSPFFLKQYVKSHCADVLEELPLLLSEMALRLPYQVKKVITQQANFDSVSFFPKIACFECFHGFRKSISISLRFFHALEFGNLKCYLALESKTLKFCLLESKTQNFPWFEYN